MKFPLLKSGGLKNHLIKPGCREILSVVVIVGLFPVAVFADFTIQKGR